MSDDGSVPGLPPPAKVDPTRRRFGSSGSGRDAAYAASLAAELLLLREENARLRSQFSELTDSRRVAAELLALSGQRSPEELDHLASEAATMRGLLTDVCKELGHAVVTLQTRLHALRATVPPTVAAQTPPISSAWLEPAIRAGRRGSLDSKFGAAAASEGGEPLL